MTEISPQEVSPVQRIVFCPFLFVFREKNGKIPKDALLLSIPSLKALEETFVVTCS